MAVAELSMPLIIAKEVWATKKMQSKVNLDVPSIMSEWLLDFKIAASQSPSAMRTDWGKERCLRLFLVCILAIGTPYYCQGGGVTVITHGYNSDVNGWVT